VLAREIGRTVGATAGAPELRRWGEQLSTAFARVADVARQCQRDPAYARTALANAHVFLEMTGHVVVAWMWLRMALVAARATTDDFYRGKLQACSYFYHWELPKTEHWYRLLNESESTCETMRDEWF
jgi:hypothetical protein